MLGSYHNRSSRSLSALADDFDPISERSTSKYRSSSLDFHPAYSSYQGPLQGNGNGAVAATGGFDPFVTSTPLSAAAVGSVAANPYSHDTAAAMGGAFFASQTGFQQPVCFSLECCVNCLTIRRSSIIYTRQLALTIRTLWATSAMSTTSFSLMISVRNCRRRLQLPCKPCPVRGSDVDF